MTRVLIVDDKDENVYYLEALLAGHGYSVEGARHGAEALIRARRSPPDAVVSDLLMPVMDGYTLLRHWKSDVRLKRIPFIVYTATYTESQDEKLALSLGADEFILKPTEPDAFVVRLREVLGRANGPAAPPTRHQTGDEKELLRIYSEALIRKLEEKTLQLEESNRALQQDIEHRQAMEESLRESEERFRATFEQAAVGIAHVDADGRFLRVNDKLCEITGFARDELLKRTYIDLTAPVDRAEGDYVRREMLAGSRKFYSAEKRYVRKAGDLFWVRVVTTLLRGSTGEPKYFITVIDDITEQKALEEKFLRAQRLESLGTLAGGIAHDLNNILAPIMMGVSLLEHDVPDGASRKVVDTIALSAKRGTELVRQVLSFARGVEGARVVVHLGHVVKEIEALIQNTFPKGIVLRSRVPKNLWLVTGDPTQLNQALLNLCVNARDAMTSSGTLTLTAQNLELTEPRDILFRKMPAGRYVQMDVQDTGSGIAPDVMNRIFEPFFTTKEIGKGTGLGLSTALGIVRNHGGHLDVQSRVGAGTTFSLFLPAHMGDPEAAQSDRRGPALARGAGETILIIEDEESVRMITKQTLESHGYHALAAEDGPTGLGLFAANRNAVSLVITDMMMPRMDGAVVIRELRRENPALPILATSGVNEDGSEERARSAGVNRVLVKPFSAEILLCAVRDLLARDPAGGEPREPHAA